MGRSSLPRVRSSRPRSLQFLDRSYFITVTFVGVPSETMSERRRIAVRQEEHVPDALADACGISGRGQA
ncbi:hypothetical protein TRIP_B50275 [uncultured Desulfatiglans sp.]|uniref:Uncharacterized protein n=1 Tax=Uncultured Desulfatiglans sp. TaxID=1748965 RepID=A0A653AH54_UNCDX|nr:hypothetical protein TRIP_B50275 [uncultured Desulfatiglans sp.]